MDSAHATALLSKHAGIDARIGSEIRRPSPDSVLISELKKKKLRLKEELAGL